MSTHSVNPIQTVLAVAACKATRGLLRLRGSGGTAMPGKVAMKFARNILEVTSHGMEIIVVTGTNGKTTTCRMLEHAMTASGKAPLANKSGANLLSGVTAEITCNATWTGRPKSHYAVIECDEGALKQVVPLIHPKVIVVTNLFRDQLDRYGEITHTRDEIKKGIDEVPDAIVCLNADDSLVSSLAFDIPNKVVYYGFDVPYGDQKDPEISDAKYCVRCGHEYRYHYHTYAHLGDFYCPHCGYRRKGTEVAVTRIDEITAAGSRIQLRLGSSADPASSNPEPSGRESSSISPSGTGSSNAEPSDTAASTSARTLRDNVNAEQDNAHNKEQGQHADLGKYEVTVGLPAVYNLYNATAAVCGYHEMGFPVQEILKSLSDVHSSFGRMETFQLGNVRVQMILVKNPAGCNQALNYLVSLQEDFTLVVCLNDRTADGHDISWIWDADYEQLADPAKASHVKQIIVSGDRAEDMRLRLKYAGVNTNEIEMIKDNAALLDAMKRSALPVFVIPNYTSMLALRKSLSDATGGEAFWK